MLTEGNRDQDTPERESTSCRLYATWYGGIALHILPYPRDTIASQHSTIETAYRRCRQSVFQDCAGVVRNHSLRRRAFIALDSHSRGLRTRRISRRRRSRHAGSRRLLTVRVRPRNVAAVSSRYWLPQVTGCIWYVVTLVLHYTTHTRLRPSQRRQIQENK